MVDQNALPRLGCDEDLVRGFGLFATPRNLGHGAEEAASAPGQRHLGQLLGDFPVLGHLLSSFEGSVAEAVVPLHQLGLVVGGSKSRVVILCRWGRGIKGEWPLVHSLVGGGVRWR